MSRIGAIDQKDERSCSLRSQLQHLAASGDLLTSVATPGARTKMRLLQPWARVGVRTRLRFPLNKWEWHRQIWGRMQRQNGMPCSNSCMSLRQQTTNQLTLKTSLHASWFIATGRVLTSKQSSHSNKTCHPAIWDGMFSFGYGYSRLSKISCLPYRLLPHLPALTIMMSTRKRLRLIDMEASGRYREPVLCIASLQPWQPHQYRHQHLSNVEPSSLLPAFAIYCTTCQQSGMINADQIRARGSST